MLEAFSNEKGVAAVNFCGNFHQKLSKQKFWQVEEEWLFQLPGGGGSFGSDNKGNKYQLEKVTPGRGEL